MNIASIASIEQLSGLSLLVGAGVAIVCMAWMCMAWLRRESVRQVAKADEIAREDPAFLREFAGEIGEVYLQYSEKVMVFLCLIDRSLLKASQATLLDQQSDRLQALGFRHLGCTVSCRMATDLHRAFEPSVAFVFVAKDGLDRVFVFCSETAVLGIEAESESMTGEFHSTAASSLSKAVSPAVARFIMGEGALLEELLAQHRRRNRSGLLPVASIDDLMASQRRQEVANRRALLERGIPDDFLEDPEIDVLGKLGRHWPLGIAQPARAVMQRQVRPSSTPPWPPY